MKLNSSTLLLILLLFFPFAIYFKIDFYDEAMVAISVLLFILKKDKIFSYNDRLVFYLLGISYVIGFISNYVSKLNNSVTSVLIDTFAIYKPFLALIAIKTIINKKVYESLILKLRFISKIYLIIGFILSTASQLVDLGMTKEIRYGIKSFYFLYDTPTVFGITTIIAITVLAHFDFKKNILFFLLGAVSLFLTTKGVFYSFIIFSFAIILFSRRKKINRKNLIVLTTLLLIGSSYQITTYFEDITSPRMVFINYSFKVANDYFPLGSGFGTYGSEEAKKNYSSLYKKYGFERIWGMSEEESQFLNDNYWAMIIGQLGYFGFLLFLIMLVIIFNIFNNYSFINPFVKAFIISSLLMLYVTSIATGITKSSIGVCLFFFLGIVVNNQQKYLAYDGEFKEN